MEALKTPLGAPAVENKAEEGKTVRLATVVSALSRALDLSTGQPMGHAINSCVLGMRIGEEYGLNPVQLDELYYALLLKDCGCSGNASKTYHALAADDLKAKRDVKTTDWTSTGLDSLRYALSNVAPGKPFLERVQVLFKVAANQKTHTKEVTKLRCQRGATLARLMGLADGTAAAILDLDEHWDGSGYPEQLRGGNINLYSRIMLLAQTLENFATDLSKDAALEVIKKRSKKWFDPDIVKVAISLARRDQLWIDLDPAASSEYVLKLDRREANLTVGEETLDAICSAFAQIVDAKSPFTYNHSNGVANTAVAIARRLCLPRERIIVVRYAALLHDLGKLGISNTILEKPGKLTEEEWQAMKCHSHYTWQILNPIPHFQELSEVAASHHEKLDGSGYHRGLHLEHLSIESRILAVANKFDGLTAQRPYRDSFPIDQVFSMINREVPDGLDEDCVRALEQSGVVFEQAFKDLHSLNHSLALYR